MARRVLSLAPGQEALGRVRVEVLLIQAHVQVVEVSGSNGASSPREIAIPVTREHRTPLPNVIIAAAAELHGATVLYIDSDYDRIAAVTGQPTRILTTTHPRPIVNLGCRKAAGSESHR